MRKIIAAVNTTIDGIYDHTAGIPDAEIHQHYTELLDSAGAILYGRTTYQLMQFWQTFIEKPSGEKFMDDFAKAIDRVPKIVFSHTLANTGWQTAQLATQPLDVLVRELKHQPGQDVFVGSRSLMIQLMNLNPNLIDEYQLCIHPVVAGKGSPLFDKINLRTIFKLINTKTFSNGAVTLYYEPK